VSTKLEGGKRHNADHGCRIAAPQKDKALRVVGVGQETQGGDERVGFVRD